MVDSLLPGERETGLLNCFALVSYLPDQLGRFLDELRRDVEPNTLAPRAHITLLPPRSLTDIASAQAAERYLEMMLAEVSAVEIFLGPVEVFPVTNVVYVAVDGGFLQMRKLHERLNSGPVGFAEPFHQRDRQRHDIENLGVRLVPCLHRVAPIDEESGF